MRSSWAVLALVPALLSGCAAVGLSSPGPTGGASAGATPSSGPGWLVVQQGSATPSAPPSRGSAIPTPIASGGFLPVVAPAPTRGPALNCLPNTFNFTKVAIAYVTPATTSAVVSWYNVGGYNLVQFRLTAISQDLVSGKQRDIGFTTVVPGAPCGQMSTTITGLDRKTGYIFSIDAVVLRRSGDGTHAATVARSHVIYTR
jgi:hypothetical protein